MISHLPSIFHHRRRGFTLVELLVVITIIGILIALLLPAVQAAREAARRMQCQNNVKQIALGCLLHEQAQGWFPTGGWGWAWLGDPDQGYGMSQPGGWAYNILPYIEQEPLHQLGAGSDDATRMSTRATLFATPLATFYCPSRRAATTYPKGSGTVLRNSDPLTMVTKGDYAINAGSQSPGPSPCLSCACYPGPLSYSDPSPGWHDTSQYNGVSYERSTVRMAAISDGTSNTYLLGEKYLRPDDYTTGADPAHNVGLYVGYSNDSTRAAYYGPLEDTPGYTDIAQCRFGSPHAGTWNAALCDGSVRGISYSISLTVHQQLGNRQDGQVIDGASF